MIEYNECIILITLTIILVINMLGKTKTATLILQKQLQKQQSNPQSSKTILVPPQPKPLKIHHLAPYNIFNLTFRTEPSPALQTSSSSLPAQYCLLEKQNYRLIEANFNILAKFAGVVELIRKELMRVLQFIQLYQYVLAVEAIYALLDRLKKVDLINAREAQGNVKYFDIEELKRNISSKLSLHPQQQVSQPQPQVQQLNNSMVQQYPIAQSKPPRPARHPLTICNGVSSITHNPPPKPHDDDYILEALQTPYFTQPNNTSLALRNRDSFENSGFGDRSRVRSAFDIGVGGGNGYQGSLYGQVEERSQYEIEVINQMKESRNNRLYSQKNITLIRGNHRKGPLEDPKPDQLYHLLLTQATSIEYLLQAP